MIAAFRFFIATTVLFSGFSVGEEGTIGIFQGLVIPGSSREAGKYIYVQGRNGSLRRVKITGAKVSYADSIPLSQRIKSPIECLQEHPEVKVTAEQGGSGEWKAREIVIMRLSQSKLEVVLRTA
jgi:hypothetical protein